MECFSILDRLKLMVDFNVSLGSNQSRSDKVVDFRITSNEAGAAVVKNVMTS